MGKFFKTYTLLFLFFSLSFISFFIHSEGDLFLGGIVGDRAYAPFFPVTFLSALACIFCWGMSALTCKLTQSPQPGAGKLVHNLGIFAGTLVLINGGFYLYAGWFPEIQMTYLNVSGVLLSILIIILKNGLLYIKEREDDTPKKKITTALFLSSTIFAILFLITGIILNLFCIDAHYYPYYLGIYIILFIFLSWFTGIAIFITYRFLSFSRFLPALLSILTLGFIICCVIGCLTLSFVILFEQKELSTFDSAPSRYTATVEDLYDYDDEEPEEVSPYVDEEYHPTIRYFSFDFLWEDPTNDTDSIKAAVEFDRRKRIIANPKHDIYWYLMGEDDDDNEWYRDDYGKLAFSTLITYIHNFKTTENLPAIFESYIDLLPILFTPERYNKTYRARVEMLLYAFHDLFEKNDFNKFYRVYRIMSNGESDSDKYEELSSFIYAYNCEYFYYDYEYDTDNILNSYGFWGRRYNEGNHRDIYYILKRIDRFYNNDGY